MKTVRPRPLGVPGEGLRLSPEEDFVLARIDGRLSLADLAALTGIEAPRVEQIVSSLASRGAVALEAADASSGYLPEYDSDPTLPNAEGTTSLADFAAALGMDPSPYATVDVSRLAAVEQPVAEGRVETRSSLPPPLASEAPSAHQDLESAQEETAARGEEHAEAAALREQDYRKLYETQFHSLAVDVRAGFAKTAHGADLVALCLDADARVIASILENATMGLLHARLIALHHRTTTGLELMSRRQDLLRDLLVERRLLRNPMSGDTVLGRVMASKRLFQTYKIAIDREVPELTRSKARGFLRTKYQGTPPEERADLILRTEGRCLILMTGCTFDAKMTGILCGRPFNSVMFIQNLAKFSATPPLLLAHLIKQPFVRKNAPLKKMLLQHPNVPGDVKRQG